MPERRTVGLRCRLSKRPLVGFKTHHPVARGNESCSNYEHTSHHAVSRQRGSSPRPGESWMARYANIHFSSCPRSIFWPHLISPCLQDPRPSSRDPQASPRGTCLSRNCASRTPSVQRRSALCRPPSPSSGPFGSPGRLIKRSIRLPTKRKPAGGRDGYPKSGRPAQVV